MLTSQQELKNKIELVYNYLCDNNIGSIPMEIHKYNGKIYNMCIGSDVCLDRSDINFIVLDMRIKNTELFKHIENIIQMFSGDTNVYAKESDDLMTYTTPLTISSNISIFIKI